MLSGGDAAQLEGRVSYHVEDRIAEISIGRAPVNAMDLAFIEALLSALERAADDDDARVVVVTSALEGVFSAGMDLSVVRGATSAEFRNYLNKIYKRLFDIQYGLGKPSIAAINGAARGAGVTLAISCDMVVASETTNFAYPEIDVGIIPGVHFAHLPRQIGRHAAFDLLFTGRTFFAAEALSLGLISRVVPEPELRKTTFELARLLAAKPVNGMRIGRNTFMRFNDLDYRRSIEAVIDTLCSMIESSETQEKLSAVPVGKNKQKTR